MSRIIVDKFFTRLMYSNAIFKSSLNSLLNMNRYKSIKIF
jgi:hypothetical protein